MRHVPFVDSTGIQNLKAVISQLRNDGIKVVLSGVNDNVRKDLDKSRISFMVGKANIFPSFDLAMKRAISLLQVVQG
jgi:sulfate permease, SulP family